METPATSEKFYLQEALDCFWETFPPIWNIVRSNVRKIVTDNFDINVEQFHILRLIRKGIQSISELAEAKQISRPGVSQAVDLLVVKGLVSRHPDTNDRRYILLKLTPAGDDLLNEIFKINRAWMAEKMSALDPDDVRNIVKALDILRKTLEPQQIN